MSNGSDAKRARKCPTVVICEYHHEVLTFIHQAIRQKKLPFSNIQLIHFDSHPDLMFPLDQLADICFEKQGLYDNIGIADWILPLVYEKHINSVVWIKPPWASQISTGAYKVQVGKERASQGLRISCGETYFLEELLYCNEDELESKTQMKLHVCEVPLQMDLQFEENKVSKALPSNCKDDEVRNKKEAESQPSDAVDLLTSLAINMLDKDSVYILDIDLDFFSTQNPFKLMFEKECLQVLEKLFHFEGPKNGSLQSIEACAKNRKSQIKTLDTCYSHFLHCHVDKDPGTDTMECHADCLPEVDNPKLAAEYINFMDSYCRRLQDSESKGDLDLEMLHFAGLCGNLPHHVSTKDQIRCLLSTVKNILSKLPKPSLVTIARSTEDDYTPADQVEFIQEEVISMLRDLYNEVDVHETFREDLGQTRPKM